MLNWLSFGHTSIPKTLGSEARILAFYYWLTYCILKAGKPKFEAIQAPSTTAAAATGATKPAAAGAAERGVIGGSGQAAAADPKPEAARQLVAA